MSPWNWFHSSIASPRRRPEVPDHHGLVQAGARRGAKPADAEDELKAVAIGADAQWLQEAVLADGSGELRDRGLGVRTPTLEAAREGKWCPGQGGAGGSGPALSQNHGMDATVQVECRRCADPVACNRLCDVGQVATSSAVRG
jgi:hypothetical protein